MPATFLGDSHIDATKGLKLVELSSRPTRRNGIIAFSRTE